uniref:CAF1 family ribonuclease, putative n=1 Tax=Theileria annulata TaxID=5874 RepID=A0A3B0MWX5_THEAN
MDESEAQNSDLDSILDRIPNSKFIVIDCEFSGINPKSKSIRTLDDYLMSLKEDAEEYALLQIGFCLAMNSKNPEEELWQLYPYSFYTLSSEITNTIFLNDSMKWLRDNGFSLDKWIDQGLDFKRLGGRYSNSGGYITKRNRSNQLNEVIRAIIEYRIPLVFHNGMLDILHIYDKFIAQIPDKPTQISKEISKIFVGGVFDTKLVGKYLFDNLNCNLLRNTCLPVLYTTLTR